MPIPLRRTYPPPFLCLLTKAAQLSGVSMPSGRGSTTAQAIG